MRRRAKIAQLTGFSSILQVNGYAAYKPLVRHHDGAIQLAFAGPCPPQICRGVQTEPSTLGAEVIERLHAALWRSTAAVRNNGWPSVALSGAIKYVPLVLCRSTSSSMPSARSACGARAMVAGGR